ncbi:MAG: hypothetical protein IJ662_02145 [Clostridia bacterium]|nr:hypothetical protein [Clostridia bacterium]
MNQGWILKGSAAGLTLLLLIFFVFSTGAETLRVDQVATIEEARQFTSLLNEAWGRDALPSYTQRTGFSGAFISPDEAYRVLTEAYEGEGDAGTARVLTEWGMPDVTPCGRPARRALAILGDQDAAALAQAEAIGFADTGWGADLSLIFFQQGGNWQLIDCVPGEALQAQAVGDQGLYLLYQCTEQRTGYDCQTVSVYNLLTRQTEIDFIAQGSESWYREEEKATVSVQVWSAVTFARDGLHLFCQRMFSTQAEGEEAVVRFEDTQTIRYAYGADGSLLRDPDAL